MLGAQTAPLIIARLLWFCWSLAVKKTHNKVQMNRNERKLGQTATVQSICPVHPPEVHGNEKLFYARWWKKQQTTSLPGKKLITCSERASISSDTSKHNYLGSQWVLSNQSNLQITTYVRAALSKSVENCLLVNILTDNTCHIIY